MALEMPKPIQSYFDADKSDGQSIVPCFTEDAVVRDEGKTYMGHDAIRRWKEESAAKYTYTSEPFAVETNGGRTVVSSHLVGDFPGSPVDLRYTFLLRGDRIAALEIAP